MSNELYKGDYVSGKTINKPVYYENVVNEFFLPVLKSKVDNPKEQLEKELKNLNNKKERIRKAYID